MFFQLANLHTGQKTVPKTKQYTKIFQIYDKYPHLIHWKAFQIRYQPNNKNINKKKNDKLESKGSLNLVEASHILTWQTIPKYTVNPTTQT